MLDRWHLTEARRRAWRAAVPDTATRAPWSARLAERLEQGDVAGALAVLGEVDAIAPHAALAEFGGYLSRRWHPAFPTMRPGGPPASGLAAGGSRRGSMWWSIGG